MANLEQHCRHTLQIYGITGEEIHKWMDSPVRIFGPNHRIYRHNVDEVVSVFKDKYGEVLVRNIALDHLLLDLPKRKKQKLKKFEKFETVKSLCEEGIKVLEEYYANKNKV